MPNRKKLYFDDVFADGVLLHTFNRATFGGAAIGECLIAASKVDEKDTESWWRAWSEQGRQAESVAETARARDHRVTAKNAYLRAMTYHYNAHYALRPTDPRYVPAVEHFRSLFRKFAALSPRPIEAIEIPYEGKTLPGYFLRPDASGTPRPTLVGGDVIAEELYFWVAPGGLERDYNILLVDLPGIGLNPHHGIHFRPDTEVGVGACVDWLYERGDVDASRIAFYGGGPGGWVAVRAATYEERIAACVADPFVPDTDGVMGFFSRPEYDSKDVSQHTLAFSAVEQVAVFYGGEDRKGYPKLTAEPEKLRCPLLCMSDPGDSDAVRAECDRAVATAPHPANVHRVLTPEDGTTFLRAADNFILKQGVMYDWLDEVLIA
ncbi:alpha/beta hydrolase family protein [Nonomuraea helvata]|uniref:Alpha/beta hydrolase family protein n=1 Tax=Nonomuraea helvata TaxID=37484 RepID=A0ABV5S9V6_9ACTN